MTASILDEYDQGGGYWRYAVSREKVGNEVMFFTALP